MTAAGYGRAPSDAGQDTAALGSTDSGQEKGAPAEAALEKALALALAHLNRRERTIAEVLAHLERKGVSEASAEIVVRRLCDDHLVDDERFAAMFVSDKRELEGWGAERIRRGLAARGVARELAERALADADADAGRSVAPLSGGADTIGGPGEPDRSRPLTELDRALALLRRRFPDPPRDRRDRNRALGMLLRKGYESELAVDALAAHARAGGR